MNDIKFYSERFASGSSSAVYETIVRGDGRLSCDCRGWVNRAKSKTGPRTCKHTNEVMGKFDRAGVRREERSVGIDSYIFILDTSKLAGLQP